MADVFVSARRQCHSTPSLHRVLTVCPPLTDPRSVVRWAYSDLLDGVMRAAEAGSKEKEASLPLRLRRGLPFDFLMDHGLQVQSSTWIFQPPPGPGGSLGGTPTHPTPSA